MSGEENNKGFTETIVLPEGVSVTVDKDTFTVNGPKGSTTKKYPYKRISLALDGSNIVIKSLGSTQREFKLVRTFAAHLKNMIKGVQEGYVYKLKICSSHFPMKVKLSGRTLKVENFMGESNPRVLTLKENAKVKIDGSFIIVESHNKELAGQVAADIEQLTRLTNKDRRVFQDGIYIVEKAGKLI